MSEYTDRITAEHADKPKFVALVDAITGDASAIRDFDLSLIDAFDLDLAVGAQLDAVGEWVGISRQVAVPIAGVYFSFDVVGLGFDQGVWKGPFDPDTGITTLPDDTYRILIRAKIGANRWDGSMVGWKAIIDQVFGPSGQIPVTANDEVFGTTDGTRTQFQLTYSGFPVYTVNGVTVYRNDWQGDQLLFPIARTNMLTNSAFSGGGVAPTGWTAITSGGVASSGASSLFTGDGAFAYTFSGGVIGNRSAVLQSITLLPNTTYVYSAYIEAVTGTLSNSFAFGSPSLPSGATAVFLANGVPASGTDQVVTGLLSYVITVRATGALTPLRAGWGVSNNTVSVGSIRISRPQLEAFPVATSRIVSTTGPTTVTDYILTNTGLVTIADPTSGATLSWSGTGTQSNPGSANVFVQDNGDMTMTVVIAGAPPSALFVALLTGGYLPLKPEAIGIAYYFVNSVPGVPAFGFDAENGLISGFDVGAWVIPA